jgi:predicted RNA-binding protein associated with RNAse of E/G family
MSNPQILRKRYIPCETTDISSDELLYRDEDIIITRWNPIKPRKDFSRGISFTFLKEGYKISKFFDKGGDFIYWYCDIIDVEYDCKKDVYTLNDLLIDVKILPDGTVYILDCDELAEALENSLITQVQALNALRRMDKLLKMIYNGDFPPEACDRRFEG